MTAPTTDSRFKPLIEIKTVMVKIDGKTFRCPECSSNCFHHPTKQDEHEGRYECNGCGALYIGS